MSESLMRMTTDRQELHMSSPLKVLASEASVLFNTNLDDDRDIVSAVKGCPPFAQDDLCFMQSFESDVDHKCRIME